MINSTKTMGFSKIMQKLARTCINDEKCVWIKPFNFPLGILSLTFLLYERIFHFVLRDTWRVEALFCLITIA